jgi:hypothetical protein
MPEECGEGLEEFEEFKGFKEFEGVGNLERANSLPAAPQVTDPRP